MPNGLCSIPHILLASSEERLAIARGGLEAIDTEIEQALTSRFSTVTFDNCVAPLAP
jgi:hypothetical protein